ncbi:MAG: hypothetical protein HN416_12975 [Nitrospina sp.]|nr:hypothetical protein [Nitrospina sp.]
MEKQVNYKEWHEEIYQTEFPGKSKARNEFEKSGKIPKNSEVSEMSDETYQEILAALAVSDNYIRKENEKFFNEQEKSRHGEHITFPGSSLHTESSLSLQAKRKVSPPLVTTPSPTMTTRAPMVKKTFMGEVNKLKDEGLETDVAMMKVVRDHPELHEQYLKGEN